MGMLFEPAKSTTDVLENFADMVEDFQARYRYMLKKVLKFNLVLVVSFKIR